MRFGACSEQGVFVFWKLSFADGSFVGCEKRKIKVNFKDFCPSKGKFHFLRGE